MTPDTQPTPAPCKKNDPVFLTDTHAPTPSPTSAWLNRWRGHSAIVITFTPTGRHRIATQPATPSAPSASRPAEEMKPMKTKRINVERLLDSVSGSSGDTKRVKTIGQAAALIVAEWAEKFDDHWSIANLDDHRGATVDESRLLEIAQARLTEGSIRPATPRSGGKGRK